MVSIQNVSSFSAAFIVKRTVRVRVRVRVGAAAFSSTQDKRINSLSGGMGSVVSMSNFQPENGWLIFVCCMKETVLHCLA